MRAYPEVSVVLSAFVLVLCTGIAWATIQQWEQLYRVEKEQMLRDAGVALVTTSQHTVQIIRQVDVLLNAVRQVYMMTGSLRQTEEVIKLLPFDPLVIEDVFLADAAGNFLIPSNLEVSVQTIVDRGYFLFQREAKTDNLFLSPVQKGRLTQQYRFRISRKITAADGSFAGVVLATVNPESIVNTYRQLNLGLQNVASLLGTTDRMLRARFPLPPQDKWEVPIEAPLWSLLESSTEGGFAYQSAVDDISRVYVYQLIAGLPLVMVVGFSESDVLSRVGKDRQNLVLFVVLGTTLLLFLYGFLMFVLHNREKLRLQALYDPLTGLPSRILFLDRTQRALLHARRHQQSCFLMFGDLDGFKAINDTLGHEAGDLVLKTVAERMNQVVRTSDTVCRWGGDEFQILLTQVSNETEAADVASRLLLAVGNLMVLGPHRAHVGISLGIAGYPKQGETLEQLRQAADAAMYLAKQQGKNQVVVSEYDPETRLSAVGER